jgi:hypothetical protein
MKTTKDNIEVILFDYAEGNLSPQERKDVEEFLEKNPQYIEMLNAYKESEPLEKPLGLVFKEKEELFSLATGKKARKIVFKPSFVYWSSAVAAVVLLFFLVKPLVKNEQTPTATSKELIAENNPKKKFEKAKEKFSNPKKKIKKAKENFVFVIEEEQDTIIHQIAFQEIELPSAEIEKQERILYMRYEESIMVKKVSKPSLASRIVKSIGLEEKIEEFYNSDFVSNTRNTINTARSLGKKLVKTTTTTIKREESINV